MSTVLSKSESSKKIGAFTQPHFSINGKSGAGFTILELLVVVAIIGIISALGLAMLSDTRARSRDARRLSDIREIEKALHLYYSDTNSFPVSAIPTTLDGSESDGLSNTLETAGYISDTPSDPRTGTYDYTYETNGDGTDFTLSFCLETDTVQTFNQGCGNTVSP